MWPMYLVTAEHLLHHAFMLRGIVAVVGWGKGPVRTGAERIIGVLNTKQPHRNMPE